MACTHIDQYHMFFLSFEDIFQLQHCTVFNNDMDYFNIKTQSSNDREIKFSMARKKHIFKKIKKAHAKFRSGILFKNLEVYV